MRKLVCNLKRVFSFLIMACFFTSLNDGVSVCAQEKATQTSAIRIFAAESQPFTFVKNDILDIQIAVDTAMEYALLMKYRDVSEESLSAEIKATIDNQEFPEIKNMIFPAKWVNPNTFDIGRYGNEMVPISTKAPDWQERYFRDSAGLSRAVFTFDFSAGAHNLTLECLQGGIEIEWIQLVAPPKAGGLVAGAPKNTYYCEVEAEHMAYKNDLSIRPGGEYNSDITPYSSSNLLLNTIDEGSFSTGGQSVSYEIDCPASDFYYLGFRYKQSIKTDFPVFRDILIDGKALSKDFEGVCFAYTDSFKNLTVSDSNGKELGFYLEKGRHTITITSYLDEMSESIQETSQLIDEISDMSMALMKISGNNTDVYRDFEMDSYMPDAAERLLQWADRIDAMYLNLSSLCNGNTSPSELAVLRISAKQLRTLAQKPDELPKKLSSLSQGANSVSQYLAGFLERLYFTPLGLDKIFLYQNTGNLPKSQGLFSKIKNSAVRFFFSFINDYSSDTLNNTENLQVWVGRSRQYVQLIQQMADQNFKDSKVDVSIMPDAGKLVLANAAGNVPDIALGIGSGMAFELGIREALYNLRENPDCAEIESRFSPGLITPGLIDKKLYALPETTNFNVLFYRKDILESLGFTVPETMDEVKSLIPKLKMKGMDFFLNTAGYLGYKPFAAVMPFIYQNSGDFYGNTGEKITLTSENTLKGMTELVEMFTVYGIPYEVSNFYQHFRSGKLPIGIADFGTYNLLLNTAPEIAGAWDIALYPGCTDENGAVQRWTSGAAESAVIFSNSNKKEQAWSFLQWWTGKESQTEFASRLKNTYGKEYLWNTANLEAFARLTLNESHKQVILEQLQWVAEVPRVPGSYMMEREVSNALISAALYNEKVRDVMDKAQMRAQKETFRKLEEFGYMKNGNTVKEFLIPSYTRELRNMGEGGGE